MQLDAIKKTLIEVKTDIGHQSLIIITSEWASYKSCNLGNSSTQPLCGQNFSYFHPGTLTEFMLDRKNSVHEGLKLHLSCKQIFLFPHAITGFPQSCRTICE